MTEQPKKIIDTEAALIEALSQTGRFMEFFSDNERLRYGVRVSLDGERIERLWIPVNYELAARWTEQHPEFDGPWCSTWCLPEFWPWPYP